MSEKTYPYFNYLLNQFKQSNSVIENSFGRHVHWGYWPQPENAVCDDKDYANAAEALTKQLVSTIQITDNQSILDVGCGFGGTTAYLNEHYKNMTLTGVNIDERQLERARTIVQPENNNQITFQQADACNLPYHQPIFDNILAVECIFHFPSREKFFQEVQRTLKKNGSLVLSDFIPSKKFLLFTKPFTNKLYNKYSPFGECQITHTIEMYQALANKYHFKLIANDITKHTLPTYDFLLYLFNKVTPNNKRSFISKLVFKFMKWVAQNNHVTYQILKFEKVD